MSARVHLASVNLHNLLQEICSFGLCLCHVRIAEYGNYVSNMNITQG